MHAVCSGQRGAILAAALDRSCAGLPADGRVAQDCSSPGVRRYARLSPSARLLGHTLAQTMLFIPALAVFGER
eukprot:scaffold115_cov304-Prasinococcus_capsulatus_cf.AAC.12